MKACITLCLFLCLLTSCVFVYNTGQGVTFNIDDKDNPDIQATGKLK